MEQGEKELVGEVDFAQDWNEHLDTPGAVDARLVRPPIKFYVFDLLRLNDEALLEGFNFFKLQNAKGMPDNAVLFALQVSDREHLVSSLKAKGLDFAV